MLSVSVLGPLELRRDGELLPIRPGKTTEVLVRLALEAGAAVRSERLIEDLWGRDAVLTQRNTLQTKVSRLRKQLGVATLVTGDRAGYTLHVAPDDVDALVVLRMAGETRAAVDAGDPASAARLATDALTMFRGEVLCDAGDGEWVVPYRTQLEEVQLQLVEDRLAARLDLGAGGDLTGELEALVATHPLRERMWVLLITALYRDGRQADALAAYTRVRALLAEELGLDPGPALRAVEQQVLEQDPALVAARVAPGNLPALTAAMIGRDSELDDLLASVARTRLTTIVGPAGVGKTRLGIEVASGVDTTSGAWLVRLDTVASLGAVVETIASALQVTGGTEPLLLDRLRGAALLLVLDNCEHVVDAVAALVPRILDRAPGVRILCTSQVPLNLDGESVYALDPLRLEESVELFVQRAAEQRRSFVLDASNEDLVREMCGSLDGLPLAIELAAARAKTMSVPEISRRLDDRFALLRDPSTRRPERQRALATAIDWSYELLFPDDQRGLWALSSFAGAPTIGAAEVVLAALAVPATTAIDVVTRLVDRSLVAVDEDDRGESRYRLLDSVRAFGWDRCREAGLDEVTSAAHVEWYAAAADAARTGTRGPGQAAHLAFARLERADIDAAVAWAETHDPLVALRIVNGFGWTWVVAGDGAASVSRLQRALAAAGEAAPAIERAQAWSHIAWLAAGNDVDEARAAAEQAVAIGDGAGDAYTAAVARLALGFVLIQQARPDDALAVLAEARAAFHARGDAWEEGSCCVLTVHATLFQGDTAAAVAAREDAEQIVRPLGDDWGTGHLDAILGRVAAASGTYDGAATHLRRAAAAAARLGFATSEGYHLVNLGCALHDAGDDAGARAALERAAKIGTTTAELRLAALARTHLGRVLLATGDRASAVEVLTAADTWFRASGGGDGADLAATLLAESQV